MHLRKIYLYHLSNHLVGRDVKVIGFFFAIFFGLHGSKSHVQILFHGIFMNMGVPAVARVPSCMYVLLEL